MTLFDKKTQELQQEIKQKQEEIERMKDELKDFGKLQSQLATKDKEILNLQATLQQLSTQVASPQSTKNDDKLKKLEYINRQSQQDLQTLSQAMSLEA